MKKTIFIFFSLSLALNVSATKYCFGYYTDYNKTIYTSEISLCEDIDMGLKDTESVIALKISASNKQIVEIKNFKKMKILVLDETFVSDGFYLNKDALEAFFKICDDLPELEYISLNDCRLMPFIKNASKYKGLKVSKFDWNVFQNCIPKFNKLEILSIEDQILTSLPSEIGRISTLKQLELKTFSMPKLPDLTMLQNLIVLKAEIGKIVKLTPSFAILRSIKYLSITGMVNFDEFPKEICSLDSLEELHIELRNANPIPQEIGNLSNLKKLYLIDCQSVSKLPETMNKLNKLEYLYFSDAKGNIDISVLNNINQPFSVMLVRCNYNGFVKQLANTKFLKNIIVPTSILPSELNKIEKVISKEKIIKQEI